MTLKPIAGILAFAFVFGGSALANPSLRSTNQQRRLYTVEDMEALFRTDESPCLTGVQLHNAFGILPVCDNVVNKETIPCQFDARIKWPNCTSISKIIDQGDCASCWATAVATSLTDRYCIATQEKDHFDFSAHDLLSCGADASAANIDGNFRKGCQGGHSLKAFRYVRDEGLVSGGSYRPGSDKGYGCRPYELPGCDHRSTDNGTSNEYKCKSESGQGDTTPQCIETCQSTSTLTYNQDKKRVPTACSVNPTVEDIQTEIMNNGPVVAVMKLYTNFFEFNTAGIYRTNQAVNNRLLMCHAVKIIGWGTDVQNGKEVPYWLVANSFGHGWGQNGFFKIIRTENIEESEDSAWIQTLVTVGRFN